MGQLLHLSLYKFFMSSAFSFSYAGCALTFSAEYAVASYMETVTNAHGIFAIIFSSVGIFWTTLETFAVIMLSLSYISNNQL